MKSNVLINRICRLIETGGASGDGALLAEEYATAANKVNNRLEAVVTAADSRSIGDAIRILSEDPPLLEEVSALDFFQRSEWENLCDMKGWTIPPRIDRQMTDRAVAIGETKDAIEPLLAMYKKAVRVNNVRLAVKSLRRLADIDHSQDWRRNLRQSERLLQLQIIDEFRLANKESKEDVCDALASEQLDTAWLDGAIASGTEEVREYRARRDAERRDMEGVEDLAILKKCLDEKWDRKLAFHLVQAVDGLVEKGWRIPDDDKRVVDGCRVKCAHEFEQEETDRRWREVNEALNAAIQQEDGDAIREALAVPEFSNKEPDDGMAARATNLLLRMEKTRRRSRLLKMVVIFLFAAVIVSVSGWQIDQHILRNRIAESVRVLTGLLGQSKERPGFTIREMNSALDWLMNNDPRVYGTPEISGFHANLSRIESANCARTNDIENLLKELEKWVSQSRSEGISDATITNRITAIESKILSDKDEDSEFKDRLVKASESWKSHAAERASKFRGNVVPRLKSAAGRLKGELARWKLWKEVEDCKALLEEWNTVHSKYADGQSSEFTMAKNDFDNALAEHCAYSNAIARLMTAADASAVLVARGELIERYGGRREAKLLKPLPVAIDEVTDVLSSRPTVLAPFLDSIRTGISVAEFNNFLEESVRPIEKWPEYCSLYGVCEKNSQNVFAIAKGAYKVSKPGYETRWIVSCDGGLLDMDDRRIVQSLKRKAEPEARLLPSSKEIRFLVEKSKAETIDVSSFEAAILGFIDGHIKKGHEGRYVSESSTIVNNGHPTKGWMSPYRRVQFVAWYMRWLKDGLKTMPDDRELCKWVEDLEKLANDIHIGGNIPDSLSWICLWDDRIRKRTDKCKEVLNRMPIGWVKEYEAAAKADKVMAPIGSWRIAYAGKVKFDPFRFDFEKKPNEISVDAPDAAADHPLYVLRKTNDRLLLIRAFEPGTNIRWRTCEEIERNGGCLLGEPLYHVSSGERFIDVQRELSKMAGQIGVNKASEKLRTVPIFSHGVK